MLRIAWLLVVALFAACTDETPPPRAEAKRPPNAVRVRPAPAPAAQALGAREEPRMHPSMAGGEPAEASSAALASPDAVEREQAVLDFEGDLAELAPLASEDPSADVRRAAVQRLADGGRPIERAALRRALDDADSGVVVEAILALEALGETTARPALERLRAHPDAEVRALADEALGALLAER